ncbi:hypothetical protein BDZ88DRAFT_411553 [Geranomyces variabilis]|nr:hypothetical protein BDZ88DRAFT_411553 [Geranomyces variabilis]KAJ3136677.1 hypothetical protein HDU90_003054 [Geranomyces variabilis]
MGLGSTTASASLLKVADLPLADLPIINLAPVLYNPSQSERDRAAALATVGAQVRSACLDTGFFMVQGHGISASVLASVFEHAGRFFDLPPAEKAAFAKDISKGVNTGYFGVGEENLDPQNQPKGDFKEGYDLNRQLGPEDPNYASDSLPMKRIMLQYFESATELGNTLLSVFEHALGIPVGTLAPFFAEPMTMLRCLRYHPSVPPISVSQLGCGAHTDYGAFAILAQDAPGLQLFDHKRDSWLRVPHIPDTLIVNIGDILSRWTNGSFVSTVHRVLNVADNDKEDQEDRSRPAKVRHSLVFFYEPAADTVVDVLDPWIGSEGKKFLPIRFGDHLDNMYRQSYLATKT